MLRTNSKKARENLMQYIRDWDMDYLQERDEHLTDDATDDEVCKLIYRIFKSETDGDNRRISVMELFYDWAQGLALGGLFCYYYNRSAVEDLGNILEETEEERNMYTEELAEKLLTHMIYSEVTRRAKR